MTQSEQEANAERPEESAAEQAKEIIHADLQPTVEEQTIKDLTEKLARAQAEAAEYLDNWRRSAAELSNARKRMLREQAEFKATAAARVLERLLPIVDDVDRALDALPAGEGNGEWVNGFRLIQHKLQGLLESEGVIPIPVEGQMFDPALHFAVTHEECEGFGEGQIIGEAARGYRLGDKILRPSMVRVAKGNQHTRDLYEGAR
jgi:molecular chaperone GrpE